MFKTLYVTFALTTITLLNSLPAFAVIEVIEFKNPAYEQRYRSLIGELRCLKCQNQNLASSDAPLAKDLRMIASSMIKEGASDQDIKKFMRDRYGDFVLYSPPFNVTTAFLWLGPFFILLVVISSIVISVKKRQERERFAPNAINNEAERAKVRNLLRDTPSLNTQYRDDSK